MVMYRASEDRGLADFGWLKSRHTFSFGDYQNPNFMGFGPLRVINEDRVNPGGGFDTHGHRDMEIVSYVISGALAHKDSLGVGSTIQRGELQRMTAGSGIRHSEFNHSANEPVHFLQIWIEPERAGLEPGYEQKEFSENERQGQLRLMASRDGRDGSLTIHQDANLYGALLNADQSLAFEAKPDRRIWLQLVAGVLSVNDQTLETGDGLGLRGVDAITIEAKENSEFLLFDLTDQA
jgi:quercetin 2,3-dioxygenase